MRAATALPRGRRFTLLTSLAFVGAILFVPFLAADAPSPLELTQIVGFVAGATVLAACATWFGLGWSDRAQLPMPLLRALEGEPQAKAGALWIVWAIGAGCVIGASGLALLHLVQAPPSAATLPVRLGSALFAAVTLESVLHLAIMSGVVARFRSLPVGVTAATIAYVLFHLSTLGGQPFSIVVVAALGNAFAGVLFGLLYARLGYESLIVAHLIAHAVAVGFA